MEIVLTVISVVGGCLSGVFFTLSRIYKFRLKDSENSWLAKKDLWMSEKAQLERQIHDLDQQIEVADSHYQKMESIFESSTQKAFEDSRRNFLNEASQKIHPLAQQLSHTQKDLSELKKMLAKHRDQGVVIGATVEDLKTQTQKFRDLLNHNSKRGSWGEMQLKNLLESSGMLHHCDFVSQPSLHESLGEHKAVRPDAIVCLPGNRHIVIDVKTPMDAFIKAQSASNETNRARWLKKHYAALKGHVQDLSEKRYYEKIYAQSSKTYPSTTPEFVVMFLPVESLYAEAFVEHRNLFEIACKKNIIITTPSSLLALLRTLAFSWKQHHCEESSKAIQRQSEKILSDLEGFLLPYEKIGKALGLAKKEYDKAYGVLERSILPQKAMLSELAEAPYLSDSSSNSSLNNSVVDSTPKKETHKGDVSLLTGCPEQSRTKSL